MRNCSQMVSICLLILTGAVSANAEIRKDSNEKFEARVVKSIIQPGVRYEVTREVTRGRIVRAQEGQPGYVKRTYQVSFEDGKPVAKKLVSEERHEAKPVVFLIGSAGYAFSRGDFVRHKVLDMVATAYPSMCCGTGRTRTGNKARYGVVAVDPRLIPLGSKVYVEGYGLALACDTGGAIKGHRIDLCYDSRHLANSYGRHHVKVHLLR